MVNTRNQEGTERMKALGERIKALCEEHIASRPHDGFGEAMAALGYAWGRKVAEVQEPSVDRLLRAVNIAADSISGHIQNRWSELHAPNVANDG